MDVPKIGFSLDLHARNAMLTKKGLKPPGYLKTGTTVVGVLIEVIFFVTYFSLSLRISYSYWTSLSGRQHQLSTEAAQISYWSLYALAYLNDLGSGSNVDICVIEKGKTEYLRNHLTPNPRTYISSKGYTFSKKTGPIAKCYCTLYEISFQLICSKGLHAVNDFKSLASRVLSLNTVSLIAGGALVRSTSEARPSRWSKLRTSPLVVDFCQLRTNAINPKSSVALPAVRTIPDAYNDVV
ncbi:hypothetical protein L1987_11531 [Smallanthus sonchifolius]|uniref:Uncharacterized protein n=1 Tax=Smallanthus sonchifolius TaxID=185202 RepID=A0ACB9JB84_9ASTR|nr:hypothetical protein L1987_11531 [Smallanthus sonchifolius]